MKTSSILLSGAMALSISSALASGNGAGNGGVAYVCRDSAGQITKARLLDLWEPESFDAFQTDAVSEEAQLADALVKIQKLGLPNFDFLERQVQQAQAAAFHVRKPLPLSNDALPDYETEKGCRFEQVALYGWVNETGKYQLRIYDEIFLSKHFSNSDRAALWLHEGLYQIDRGYHGAEDSRRIRAINAQIFSSKAELSGPILYSVQVLMGFSVDSALSLRGETAFVMSINGQGYGSSGKSHCKYTFEQNGRQLDVVPERFQSEIEIEPVTMGNLLVRNVQPGRLTFRLKCQGNVALQNFIWVKGKDFADVVIGRSARDIRSTEAFEYTHTTYVMP